MRAWPIISARTRTWKSSISWALGERGGGTVFPPPRLHCAILSSSPSRLLFPAVPDPSTSASASAARQHQKYVESREVSQLDGTTSEKGAARCTYRARGCAGSRSQHAGATPATCCAAEAAVAAPASPLSQPKAAVSQPKAAVSLLRRRSPVPVLRPPPSAYEGSDAP